MPESDDVVIGNVAEDGDLGAKSLYISRVVSYYYKTELEICPVLGRPQPVVFFFPNFAKVPTLQGGFFMFSFAKLGKNPVEEL